MRRCLGCFESIKDDEKVCPLCGYKDGTPPEEAVHMEPGTILANRYTIGRVLGYGGFGVTYIGWDQRLEKKVAIKEYMPSEFSTRMPGQTKISIFSGAKNEQFTAGLFKFVDEAKRLSKFQTEGGIVKVYDCIAENDTAYIIMEYLDGEPLSEKLKREGILSEEEAIKIMMPVMKSLEIVHQAGIIHRDIAPNNIFLTKDGRVKLIDFGAARFATTSHSRSITVIIKPGYSAEEQYRSRSDQGPHTDVYSLAATMYKMLTGETPPDSLERRAKVESMKKDILTEPHMLNKNISAVTENAILNALNIRIEDRTPTVKQFMADLTSDEPVKRVYGKIKIIDFYNMPSWFKVAMLSLISAFAIVGLVVAISGARFKEEVVVPEGYTVIPNIEGSGVEEAISAIQASGLDYTTGGSAVSDYIDANLIVYQDPDSGRMVPVNSVIEITVSRGTGMVVQPIGGISTVPVFIWNEETDAVSDFEEAGLDPTVEYIYDDNVAEGQVIRAADANGMLIESGDRLEEGSEVVLYVSMGPELYEVPDVLGMEEADAVSALEQAGFSVTVAYYQTDSTAQGTVFSQSVEGRSQAPSGTDITILVAVGAA